jgi:hypothetical protein
MNRRTLPIVGAVIAVVAISWLATRLERITEKERVGASGEARRNPFLAAQRLVRRMGFASTEVKAAPDLDRLPARAVLILPNRRQALTPEHRARLFRWVEGGGHLVLETEYLGVRDPYADALGVRRDRAEPRSGHDGPVTLSHAPGPFEVAGLGSRQRLIAPSAGVRSRVDKGWGLQLLQIARGRGLVTVVTDLAFAENHLIGKADNAEFLWQLVQSLPESREVFVFNRIERLSLWEWLIDHALAVLIAGTALLALWLWRIGPRFGPLAADPQPVRRRLLDHLRASGRFYWSHQGRGRLIDAAREACLARLARAHPGFATLPAGERAGRLAAYAGIREAEATRLLAPGGAARGAEFIALMRTLQQVHARLDHGA